MSLDNQSLAHTSWNCKYHIVFAPSMHNLFDTAKVAIDAIISGNL